MTKACFFDLESNEGINEGINKRLLPLYKTILTSPGKRVIEYSDILDMHPKTLERWMKELKQLGKIEYRGSKKTGVYRTVQK